MNPELSHRLALVAEKLIKNGMSFKDKYELYKASVKATNFEDLPDNFKQAVLEAEKEDKTEE